MRSASVQLPRDATRSWLRELDHLRSLVPRFLAFAIIVSSRMTAKTFADRSINVLVLFDVDSTLAPARQRYILSGYLFLVDVLLFVMTYSAPLAILLELLSESRERVATGFMGGSGLAKISEQFTVDGSPDSPRHSSSIAWSPLFVVIDKFDYGVAEYGLTACKLGKQLPSRSLIRKIGEDSISLSSFVSMLVRPVDIGGF